MNRQMLTGNGAAAWGARLAGIDYLPAFPITPQTEIIETLAHWIDAGELDARFVTLDSEHSMITAAGAAAAAGVRVFSATSSQGLLYGMEMLYAVAGWRAPFVVVNVSRGLASPITLEPDHNDILAARDSGFLQLHCATCQEVLDGILLAYRIAEDERVRLPVLVNLDGFYLSFTREPVAIPEVEVIGEFLPTFNALNQGFRAGQPFNEAVAVLDGSTYSYFRYQAHLAALQAEQALAEAAEEFAALCGRTYAALESYCCDDAEVVLVMLGSFATKAKAAVDLLRESGQPVGLLRPFLLRPLPAAALCAALAGKRGVAVIDQNLAPGLGGVLYTELAAQLHSQAGDTPLLVSFIGGLGGRDIGPEEFAEIYNITRRAADDGQAPAPRLLYTAGELRAIRKMQSIALQQDREQRP